MNTTKYLYIPLVGRRVNTLDMNGNLVWILVAFTCCQVLKDSLAAEESQTDLARFGRASPLRWGKRAGSNILRWGKREDANEIEQIRDRREAPLR